MKSARLLLAPLLFASSFVAGCGQDAPRVPGSAIAVVGDRTIEQSRFDALIAEARQSYVASGRSFPAAGTPEYERLKQLAVRLLVEQAVLEQEAPDLGVEVNETQVAERLERLKDESFGGSEERYRARLRAAGITDDQVRDALRAQLLTQAVRQAVAADVAVETAAVKRYYEDHLERYSTPTSRAVRHILVRTKAVAARVYASVRSGASFAALARRFSRDPRTRDRGGGVTLVKGRTAPSLDRVAFSLATGAVSKPFRTRFGWELVQAVSPIHPGRTRQFAAVRDGIRRQLLAQRRAEAFQAWLAKAKSDLESRTAYAAGFAPDGD